MKIYLACRRLNVKSRFEMCWSEEPVFMAPIIKENNFKVRAIESVKKGCHFHHMTKNYIAPYNLEIMALFSDTRGQCFSSCSD